jgi:hypothetical protein
VSCLLAVLGPKRLMLVLVFSKLAEKTRAESISLAFHRKQEYYLLSKQKLYNH